MPVSKNPIDLSKVARKGRDLDKTVSEQALDFDIATIAGANLTAHILDPVDAHDASAISVEDVANRYVSIEVEGVLGELGETLQSKGSQGVLEDCTITSVGLTVTLGASSKVFINGVQLDTPSLSIVVDNNQTRYLYIDESDGVLKQAASAGSFVAGNVVLWEVTTSGGALASIKDLRYFVFGVDHKTTITAVDASATPTYNERSEGNFMSIQAALDYLSVFGVSSEDTRYTVLVRGTHTSNGITFPVGNVTLRGEGNTVVQTAGNSTTLFQLGGSDAITFENLTLHCNNHSNCIGISDSIGNSDGITVRDCRFTANTQAFLRGISLLQSGAATLDFRSYNCTFDDVVDYGILIQRPDRAILRDCTIVTTSGTGTGVSLGITGEVIHAGEGSSLLDRVRTVGFAVGVYIKTENCAVSNCVIDGLGGTHGVNVDVGSLGTRVTHTSIRDVNDGIATGTSADNTLVMGCDISDTVRGVYFKGDNSMVEASSITGRLADGTTGIRIDGANAKVVNATITCVKSAWTTEDPIGVDIRQAGASILDSVITGWYNNSGSPLGSAVRLQTSANGAVIQGTQCTANYRDIQVATGVSLSKIVISGCQFINVQSSSIVLKSCTEILVTNCHFKGGLTETGASYIDLDAVSNTTISDNTMECADRGAGVSIAGTDGAATRSLGVSITGNQIRHAGDFGIVLSTYVRNVNISGNVLDGWLGTGVDVTGYAILVAHSAGTGNRTITITGNTISRWAMGIVCDGTASNKLENLTITGNTISNIALTAALPSEAWADQGSLGILLHFCENSVVSGNGIYNLGELVNDTGTVYQPIGPDVNAYGIYLDNCMRVNVNGNTLTRFISKGAGQGDAVRLVYLNDNSGSTTSGWLSVKDNHISDVDNNGITVKLSPGSTFLGTLTLKQIAIMNNTLDTVRAVGISANAFGTLANPTVLRALNISGNQIDDCTDQGIAVSSDSYSTVWAVSLNGNQITDDAGLTDDGIYLSSNSVNGVGFSDIQVNGNSFYGAGSTGVAIHLTTDTIDVDNVQVNGNQCNDWGSFFETDIGSNAGATTAAFSNISVVGNTVRDADDKAIWLQSNGTINGARVSENTGTGKSTSLTQWVLVTCPTSGVSDLAISGNNFKNCGTYFAQFTVASAYHIDVFDNHFRDSVGTTTGGVYFDINGGASPNSRMLNVKNNTFSSLGGYGILIEDFGSTGTMNSVEICGNRFWLVATGSNTVSTVRVNPNHIRLADLLVCDNVFDDCNSNTTTVAVVRVDSTTANIELQRCSISRNHFTACEGDGISVEIDDPNTAGGFESWTIDGNIVNTDGTGIRIGSFGTTTANLKQISVSNNRVWQCTSGGIILDFSGAVNLEGLSVNGNNASDCTGGSGIQVLLANVASGTNRSLTFVGNNCNGNAGHGLNVSGVNLAAEFSIQGMVISANTLATNTLSGMYLTHSTSGVGVNSALTGVAISGNNCYNNTTYGMYLGFRGRIEGLNINNNQIDSNTDGFRIYTGVAGFIDGGGVFAGTQAGTIPGAVTVVGNSARDNTSKDVSSDGTNWDGATTPAAGICMANIDSTSGTDQWFDHFPITMQRTGTISIL